ncbi:MAG: hypothetical protein RLZZ174_1755 [Pseudomonadota bacterium]
MTPSLPASAPVPSPEDDWSLFWVALLAAVTATGPLAMQIFLPSVPLVQATFDAPAGAAQLTISLALLSVAFSTLIYGPLADRFGRRPVMLGGLALFALGSVACALAPSLPTLIAARILQSAGGAVGMVLPRAVVRDRFGPERAAALLAQLSMVMVVAPMVAPALGGVLTDVIDWRAVFWFTALAGLAIGVLVFFTLPETLPRSAVTYGVGTLLRGFLLCLKSQRYRAYMGHAAASSMIFFAFISAAPYLMVNTLGQGATAYGLWFIIISLGYMGGNLLAVRLSGRYPLLGLMLAGSTLAVLGIALSAGFVLFGTLTPAALFLPIALSMVGSGLAAPNAQAGAINVFPERAGTASGLTSFMQMFVAGLATQWVGVAQNGTPWPMLGAMILGAAVALACIVWAYRLER